MTHGLAITLIVYISASAGGVLGWTVCLLLRERRWKEQEREATWRSHINRR